MNGLNSELVKLVPERCATCKPFELIVRILGNKVAAGEITIEEAQQTIAKVADPTCDGPSAEARECLPVCSHKEGGMYLVGVNTTINTQGLEAL